MCLLHGVEDELSPFSQSVQLAEELEGRGMPYEFYSYEGLSHYFSTSADNATTCNWRQLPGRCSRTHWIAYADGWKASSKGLIGSPEE